MDPTQNPPVPAADPDTGTTPVTTPTDQPAVVPTGAPVVAPEPTTTETPVADMPKPEETPPAAGTPAA